MIERQVCIGSWLQIKQHKPGTKKPRYQPENWVILCVHHENDDSFSPRLEWYPNDLDAVSHAPMKVVELEDVAYVIPSIEDGRSFSIGFGESMSRTPLELAALSETERQNWLDIMLFKLREHDCLKDHKNDYATFPLMPPRPRVTVDSLLSMEDSVHTPQVLAPGHPAAEINNNDSTPTQRLPPVSSAEVNGNNMVPPTSTTFAASNMASTNFVNSGTTLDGQLMYESISGLGIADSNDNQQQQQLPPQPAQQQQQQQKPPVPVRSEPVLTVTSPTRTLPTYSIINKKTPRKKVDESTTSDDASNVSSTIVTTAATPSNTNRLPPPPLPPRPNSRLRPQSTTSSSSNGETSSRTSLNTTLESVILSGGIRESVYDALTDKYDTLPGKVGRTTITSGNDSESAECTCDSSNYANFPGVADSSTTAVPSTSKAAGESGKDSTVKNELPPTKIHDDKLEAEQDSVRVRSPVETETVPTEPGGGVSNDGFDAESDIKVTPSSKSAQFEDEDEVRTRYASPPDRPKTVLFVRREEKQRLDRMSTTEAECTCDSDAARRDYQNQSTINQHEVYDVVMHNKLDNSSLNEQQPKPRSTVPPALNFPPPPNKPPYINVASMEPPSTSKHLSYPPSTSVSSGGSALSPSDFHGRSLREMQALMLGREIRQGKLEVQLPLEAAVKALALVEIPDRGLWVAGWSQDKKHYGAVHRSLHVGDQVLSVNGHIVNELKDYEPACYDYTPGDLIRVMIRRLPHGLVYTLRREGTEPCNSDESWGVVCDRQKSFIASIDRQTAAAAAGMVIDCPSFADAKQPSKYCVTEINGRPVSIFSKKGEANERLRARGRDICLVVQPYDLMQSIKQQLKAVNKEYKTFSLE